MDAHQSDLDKIVIRYLKNANKINASKNKIIRIKKKKMLRVQITS